MSETAVHGHQNLSHQARDTFELSEIITIKASAWHKDTELLGLIVSSYRIYTHTSNTSISTCKLELKQHFAYSIANKLGSFNMSTSHTRRRDLLLESLRTSFSFLGEVQIAIS